MTQWHIITGEYPPQPGGVSDYSRVVARGLAAAGDAVHIYAPESRSSDPDDVGVTIHRLSGHFGARALVQLSRLLGRGTEDRLLLQYVPHAFGFKAMNFPFCLWLYAHTRKYGGAAVTFHEVNLGFHTGDPLRYRFLDMVTKVMAKLVARSAAQIFVSTPQWESALRRYVAPHQAIAWLPVPNNIPVVVDPVRIAATRRRYASACGPVIGHFGTYSPAIAAMLRNLVPLVLADSPSSTMLLLGANGGAFRESLTTEFPELTPRVIATGALPADELSMAMAACDVMAQPYPDGVTTRRTSIMTALEHGRAVVTTQGSFTEQMWARSGAVALLPVENSAAFAAAITELLRDENQRQRYGAAAKALYADRFDVRHTVEALRASLCA